VGVGWTPLAEPRRPTAAERAVLDRLVGHVDCAELTAQAATVWVTAVCECGCPSVRLRTDGPALSGEMMTRFSSTGRDDWFSIDHTRIDENSARDPRTGEIHMFQVVLHVVGGMLHDLEIFAGEGVAVEIPSPDEVDQITLM
jgi:hypothetical protein